MSDGVPDEVISPIPRFATLTRNIRTRRGEKVRIRVPLWEDERTDPAELAKGIEMDAMAYGMGCSCLQARRTPSAHASSRPTLTDHASPRRLSQVTFQARDLAEFGVSSAREWYEEMLDPQADSEVWEAFCEAHCPGTEG